MVRTQVKDTVEQLFSAAHLFHPHHRRFRESVSPKGATGTPPSIPLINVLNVHEVKQTIVAADPESLGDDKRQLDILFEALSGSSIVSVSRTAAGTAVVARKEFLRDEEDPVARTVFVKPIHGSATDKEIRDFFASYGTIEKIDRQVFVEAGEQRFKTGVSIQFSNVKAAETVAAAHLSYGVLPSVLGNYFVPKITAMMQAAHDQNTREHQLKEEAEQRRAQLAKASTPAASTSAAAAAVSEIKKFLTPGRTLRCVNVPANTTWSVIKANLGNLSLDHPNLKGKIELVRVEDSTCTAFIIMKTPEAARDLLNAFNFTVGDFILDIRRVCPNLALISGDDEKNVMRQYPLWASRKCEARVVENAKRQRE